MHGAHARRRTRAAGGVTLAAAFALTAAPAALAQISLPAPATALPALPGPARDAARAATASPPGRAPPPPRPSAPR
jgi:hypothetical protein